MREKTINMESIPSLRPEMRERTRTGSVVTIMDLVETGREEEEEIVGCKAAVEIVSRNSKKGALLFSHLTRSESLIQ
jgi:hypothetical protein